MRSLRKCFDYGIYLCKNLANAVSKAHAVHCHTERSEVSTAFKIQKQNFKNALNKGSATRANRANALQSLFSCRTKIQGKCLEFMDISPAAQYDNYPSLRAKTSVSEFLRGNLLNLNCLSILGLPRRLCRLAMTAGCHTERSEVSHNANRDFSLSAKAQNDNELGFLCMTMKTAFAILTLALFAVPNSLKAEQSGWFFGVQAGYGKGEIETELDGTKNYASYANTSFYSSEFTKVQKQERIDTTLGWNVAGNVRVVEEIAWDPTDGGVSWDPNAISASQRRNIQNYIPGGSSYGWKIGALNYTYPELIKLSDKFHGLNAGLLAGYKHFFSPKFGLRFYGLFDFSHYQNNDSILARKFQSYNLNFNADLLYNFYEKDGSNVGVFGGVSVGAARYVSSGRHLATDMDLGLNFGFRFGLNKHHSIEFFNRVGGFFTTAQSYKENDLDYYNESLLYSSTSTSSNSSNVCLTGVAGCRNGFAGDYRYQYTRTTSEATYTRNVYEATAGQGIRADSYKQPYKVGIRYIYSF